MVSGSGMLAQKDEVTADGLQKTFATNVFGHFLMVQLLTCGSCILVHHNPIMSGATVGGKVIQSESTLSCDLVILSIISWH